MKKLITLTAVLFVSITARATSPQYPSITPGLQTLRVTQVADEGRLLHASQTFPIEEIIVGVEVTVEEGDACTKLVGFDVVPAKQSARYFFKGMYDTTPHACVQISPEPVVTTLPIHMHVQNETVSRGKDITTKQVEIGGELYRVRYTRSTGEISVLPVYARP